MSVHWTRPEMRLLNREGPYILNNSFIELGVHVTALRRFLKRMHEFEETELDLRGFIMN